MFKRLREALCAPVPPGCACRYAAMGGGPYMGEYEERIDNPECPVHHPEAR
jgi:hypothetical protein